MFTGPVDGGFTDWSSWTICSATCNGGMRKRTRTCTNPVPQNGGQPCTDNASDLEQCSTDACPGNIKHFQRIHYCTFSFYYYENTTQRLLFIFCRRITIDLVKNKYMYQDISRIFTI